MDASTIAKAQFEIENNIVAYDATTDPDDMYRFDNEAQQKLLQEKPWDKEYSCCDG
jgi:hypothetical protein